MPVLGYSWVITICYRFVLQISAQNQDKCYTCIICMHVISNSTV